MRDDPTSGAGSRRPDIREIAESRLQSSHYPALRGVQCSLDDGVLTLRGCVPRYYLKQLAYSLVSDLQPSCGIRNAVTVEAS